MDPAPADLDALGRALLRAHRRRDAATRGGPEWDAAMDEVEDLESRIEAGERERGTHGRLLIVA